MDKSFPADHTSISYKETKNYPFKRDRREGTLYGNDKHFEASVKQGALGDCWLLAAMAAIGEEPERIYRLFNNEKSIPKNGQLMLKMYAYGAPQ